MRCAWNDVLRFFASAGRNRRGNVTMIFALAATVTMGISGMAIDFARAFNLKQKLNSAADSAVLAASRVALEMASQDGMSETTIAEAADQKAATVWAALLANMPAGTQVNRNISVERSNGQWVVALSYSSNLETTLTKMLGFDQINVGNTVTSTSAPSQIFLDIYLLLDSSQSMGLAATSEGQAKMLSATGCQFGCHVPGEDANYNMMRAQGIPMRIDVLREATQQLLDQASSANSASIQAGLWTFDSLFTKLADLTSNLATVRNAASAVDLPTYHDGTETDAAIAKMTDIIPPAGNGSSSSSTQKFLFIVTDGTQDGIYTGWPVPSELLTSNNGYSAGAISPTACDGLKAKGVTVAFLYTTYLPFPGQWQYDGIIAPGAEKIPANLQACASPGFYIEASDSAAIRSALRQLLDRAIAATASSAVRLAN